MKPLDLSGARRTRLGDRDSAYQVEQFARTHQIPDLRALESGWPKILKGRELTDFLDRWVLAISVQKPCLMMFGAHVIKCGLGTLLMQLGSYRAVTAFATHGAGALHDIEIALQGATSEDVDQTLADGSFGMAADAVEIFFDGTKRAQADKLGLGAGLAQTLRAAAPPHAEYSLLCFAAEQKIPFTVHAAIGTDTPAQHPGFPAAALGETSYRDFLMLGQIISELHQGGVALNCGSAVLLPEVFLKALAAARNVKGPVSDFTTVNFDMIQHYRPQQNVVRRPTLEGGRGFSFTGHHELLLPLVGWALLSRLEYGNR